MTRNESEILNVGMSKQLKVASKTSWESEGRCKRPTGVWGGARSKKYVSK